MRVLIVGVPETAGYALYGLLDALSAVGRGWETLVRSEKQREIFDVGVVSPEQAPFVCGNGIPIRPDVVVSEEPDAEIVIVPALWLGPDDSIRGRYPELVGWIRDRYADGAHLYSACSGSLMLAETGLLDGRPATSHWGFREIFRKDYPRVEFDSVSTLVYADPVGRIVTAGGATAWNDLAIHIIARHAGVEEALRITKLFLLKWHTEGQQPFESLDRPMAHSDLAVRSAEEWLSDHFAEPDALRTLVGLSNLSERTLKRRFRAATGRSLIEQIQNLRIEQAKRLLERGDLPVEEISIACGYSDPSFFRRLFKRLTGLNPGRYRKMFEPVTRQFEAPAAIE